MKTKPYAALIARLIPLADELLDNLPRGATVSDLRDYAMVRGLLSNAERDDRKAMSALGQVFRRLDCQNVGTERSAIPVTHGIPQVIWRRRSPYREG